MEWGISCLEVLWKIDTKNFSDFLHNVAVARKLEIDENDSFQKQILLEVQSQNEPKMCPKCVQNEVFQVLSKLSAWNFSDFLHEFRAP